MKELNDRDFDEVFKTRVNEEFLEFEEESWLKMEKKLRKRDRMVFFRYASIILLLLSFGLGFYLMTTEVAKKPDTLTRKKTEKIKKDDTQTQAIDHQIEVAQLKPIIGKLNDLAGAENHRSTKPIYHHGDKLALQLNFSPTATGNQVPVNQVPIRTDSANKTITNNIAQSSVGTRTDPSPIKQIPTDPAVADASEQKEKKIKVRRKIPISFAISVGPDFSSTSSILGGKTGATLGVNIGIGITKKLTVQSGVLYGSKNYNAGAMDYSFNNPNTKNIISDVNASCKVLEIPLRASFNISENQSRSIEVNAGLSSYVMLNEKYVFNYLPELNRSARQSEIYDQNNHVLSVVDLSATYNIKLKNKKFALGIEPYIKIPLTGIGEGSVPLKSSGISLKLRYDINEK